MRDVWTSEYEIDYTGMEPKVLTVETTSGEIKTLESLVVYELIRARADRFGILLPSDGRTPCTKCKGSGLIDRDGAEADKDIHPILAQKKTLCDRCDGSTYEPEACAK